MATATIRVISVNKKNWGSGFPKSLSALTAALMSEGRNQYHFVGKIKPKLKLKDVLIFRFLGQLLGEAEFLCWAKDDE
jgi:hypothetical protein